MTGLLTQQDANKFLPHQPPSCGFFCIKKIDFISRISFSIYNDPRSKKTRAKMGTNITGSQCAAPPQQQPMGGHARGVSAPNLRYTANRPAKKAGHGFSSPVSSGAAAAPFKGQRLFHGFMLRARHSFMTEPCGGTRKGSPVPLAGLLTPHGLSPSFSSDGDRFTTCPSGVI